MRRTMDESREGREGDEGFLILYSFATFATFARQFLFLRKNGLRRRADAALFRTRSRIWRNWQTRYFEVVVE